MPDETQQPTPEPTQPEPTPPENPISEPNLIPTSPDEPTAEAPVPPVESVPAPELPVAPGAPQNPESAILDKDQNDANEPLNPQNESILESTPPTLENMPEIIIEPANPNITIEKSGDKMTITEVMQPTAHSEPATAQMAGNEPFNETQDEQTKRRKENLERANAKRHEKKREKINEILNLFSEKSEITNDEVEKLLHVSDATATRYLEALEKEGKIKQVGKTGKHTHYEKI